MSTSLLGVKHKERKGLSSFKGHQLVSSRGGINGSFNGKGGADGGSVNQGEVRLVSGAASLALGAISVGSPHRGPLLVFLLDEGCSTTGNVLPGIIMLTRKGLLPSGPAWAYLLA